MMSESVGISFPVRSVFDIEAEIEGWVRSIQICWVLFFCCFGQKFSLLETNLYGQQDITRSNKANHPNFPGLCRHTWMVP